MDFLAAILPVLGAMLGQTVLRHYSDREQIELLKRQVKLLEDLVNATKG